MLKPKKFEDFTPYEVKVEAPGRARIYGIVARFEKDARALFDKGKCRVSDTLRPVCYIVDIAHLTEIPPGFDNEVSKFIDKALETAIYMSNALGPELAVGKLVRRSVADGFAWYIVTKVTKRTCTIEWRGFSADRWYDSMLGSGGTFPRSMIENVLLPPGLATLKRCSA